MTLLVILLFPLTLIIWLIYDIMVATGLLKKEPTITHEIYSLSYKYPAIPALTCLIIGMLIGHFWLQF